MQCLFTRHAPIPDHSRDALLQWGSDDDDAVEPHRTVGLSLRQERNVVHHDGVRIRCGRRIEPGPCRRPHGRMGDRIEACQRSGIREDDPAERRPIKVPGAINERLAELFDDSGKGGCTRLDHFPSEHIGIYYHGAALPQPCGHDRLARRDTAREPEEKHAPHASLGRIGAARAAGEDPSMEFLTGTGLAVAAGLNAYIPLLILGLAGRFLDFVELPASWAWLENEWVLVILGVLLVLEIIADKIPVVDSINDWVQTIVRPVAGGIAFGTGAASGTAVVTDPAGFFASGSWIPIAIGVLLALATHATKMAARPVLNAVSAGTAAPVVSTAEDVGSVTLSLSALLVPLLVLVIIVGLVVGVVVVFRRRRRGRGLPEPDAP